MRVISASELDADLRARWQALRAQNPALGSAYFAPAYVDSLVQAGWHIRIAVREGAGGPDLFLPFEYRDAERRVMAPAGWQMSDFHAPIQAPGAPPLDVAALLRAGNAKTFVFDHWLGAVASPGVVACRTRAALSPFLQVDGGLAAYRERLSRSNRETLADTLRAQRKLERERGPLRFEWQADPQLLQTLFAWKSQQYVETGSRDFFADPANRRYFQQLVAQRGDPSFEGVLSALWSGEDLLAVHVGMRSGRVLHWWIPTYNKAYARYSPGRILLAKITEQADALGVAHIDLGKGQEPYKRWLMTAETPLLEGTLDTRALPVWARRQKVQLQDALKNSSLYARLRQLKKKLKG